MLVPCLSASVRLESHKRDEGSHDYMELENICTLSIRFVGVSHAT